MANLFDKLTGKSNNTVGNVDKFSNSVSELSNTLMDFNKDFKSTTTSFSNDLRSILGKASQESSDDTEERSQDNDAFLRRLDSSTGKTINKAQVISSAAIKSFEIVANYSIKKFTDASSRIISDYNQNLTAITVRQQWTNEQYTKELREATAWIKNNGLAAQFSQIDWTSALSDALSMGLRDEVAVRVAEQNLITNKLLPQLNTNSRTYTRASKLLGDDLSKNVVAIGKYTEQVYGAEGLEDGQINNVMETIANEIIAGGAQKGLSETEVSAQIGNVLGTYQQYSAQYGAGYAENVLGTLKGIMTGDTNDVMAMAAARDSGISIGDASSLTPEAISRYFDLYTQQTETYAPNGAGIMSNLAGFGNYDNYLAVQAGNAYGDKYQDWMSQVSGTVDANSYYNSQVNDLTKGAYQSITDQQNKWNENMVANASSWLAEKIPDTEGVLNNISNIVTTWFGTWVALNAAGKLFGKGGAKAAFSQGGKLALTSADGVGGTALTGLGAGLSVASLLGGTIWGIADGVKAGNMSKENGLSGSERTANFFGGFATGRDTIGMTREQKAGYYQQNGYFSLKEVAANAGKWGLIGAGAGGIVGSIVPGAGTGAGAAIGGIGGVIAGAFTSAVDQIADAHHYKELSDASREAADAISNMRNIADNYGSAVQTNTSLLKDYQIIMDQDRRSTKEGTEAFNELKAAYPELLGNVEDVSKLDETYIGQLKTKIELEKIAIDKKLKESGNYDLNTGAYDGSDQLNQGAYEFASWASAQNGNFTEDDANNKVKEIADKYYDGDINLAMQRIHDNLGGGVVNKLTYQDTDGLFKSEYSFDTGIGSSVYNYDYASALNTNEETLNQIFSTTDGPWGQVLSEYLMLTEAYDAALSANEENPDFTAVKASAASWSKHMSEFYDDIMKGPAKQRYQANYRSQLDRVNEIYKAIGMESDIPNFRIGTDFITNGGPIMSHLGEAILTPDTTKKLSHLANGAGGITGFVNTLFSLSKSDVSTSSAVANDTELSMDPVVDAIKEQTAELQDSLAKIIVLISSLVPETSFAQVDQLLATYQGASA